MRCTAAAPRHGGGAGAGSRRGGRSRFFVEETVLFPQLALGREHPFVGDLDLFLLVRHCRPPECLNRNDAEKPDLQKLLDLVARLRAPDGCPWDREQTLPDVRAYLLEEAHELAGAIDGGDWEELAEELGDMLFQVAFIGRLAEEAGAFSLSQVIDGVHQQDGGAPPPRLRRRDAGRRRGGPPGLGAAQAAEGAEAASRSSRASPPRCPPCSPPTA